MQGNVRRTIGRDVRNIGDALALALVVVMVRVPRGVLIKTVVQAFVGITTSNDDNVSI